MQQVRVRPFRRPGPGKGYVRMDKRIFDDAKVSRPPRHHPHQRDSRASSQRAGAQDLPAVVQRFLAVFFPPARFLQHHPHLGGRGRAFPHRGQGAGGAGLEGHLRHRQEGRGDCCPPLKAGRQVPRRGSRPCRPDATRPPPRLNEIHPALLHGKRGQIRGGRGAARRP